MLHEVFVVRVCCLCCSACSWLMFHQPFFISSFPFISCNYLGTAPCAVWCCLKFHTSLGWMRGELPVRRPEKGKEESGKSCRSSPGQSGPCSPSDKQIPSFLRAQVGLSVPELAESVTGSNRHRLFYGVRAAQLSLLSGVGSLSCPPPSCPSGINSFGW